MPAHYPVVGAALVVLTLAACGAPAPVAPVEPTAAQDEGEARTIVQTVVAQTAAARGVSSNPIVSSPTLPPTEEPIPTTVKLPTPQASATATPTGPTRTPSPAPTKEPVIETRAIISIGNLHPEPSLETDPIGPICVGDSINVLEVRQEPDGQWYRVEVTKLAPDCDKARVKRGARGWVSDILVLPLGTEEPSAQTTGSPTARGSITPTAKK